MHVYINGKILIDWYKYFHLNLDITKKYNTPIVNIMYFVFKRI